MLGDQQALAEFTKSHNFVSDFELLLAVIKGRPEAQVLELAIREYQFALYAAASGRYRHAHISLRLFLELALTTINFSAHEIKLHKWLANSEDIVWAALVDPDNGVFASSFIAAFNPGLASDGKQYAAIAGQVYRECSEFVHGNLHTHGDTGLPLGFDAVELKAWIERTDAVHLAVIFAFAGRYLRLLLPDARNRLELLMMDNFGHIAAVQEIYGK